MKGNAQSSVDFWRRTNADQFSDINVFGIDKQVRVDGETERELIVVGIEVWDWDWEGVFVGIKGLETIWRQEKRVSRMKRFLHCNNLCWFLLRWRSYLVSSSSRSHSQVSERPSREGELSKRSWRFLFYIYTYEMFWGVSVNSIKFGTFSEIFFQKCEREGKKETLY